MNVHVLMNPNWLWQNLDTSGKRINEQKTEEAFIAYAASKGFVVFLTPTVECCISMGDDDSISADESDMEINNIISERDFYVVDFVHNYSDVFRMDIRNLSHKTMMYFNDAYVSTAVETLTRVVNTNPLVAQRYHVALLEWTGVKNGRDRVASGNTSLESVLNAT